MSDMWGERSARRSPRLTRGEWFRDSRFAMFIHWGLYSEAAGRWRGRSYYVIAEWLMHAARIPVREYETLCNRFNPVDFDAMAWVRLAKAAGMKYIVITSKHHDGFAMFRSAASSYNVVAATPFGRDPLQELAEACRKEGLRLGFYYSQYQDWHEPDAAGNTWDFGEKRDFDKYLRDKAMPQIRELLTRYGPVALIWFDTPGDISRQASQQLLDLVRQLQPDCLVNSRIGNGLGDYVTLGDQEVPLTAPDGLWETIDTHNDTWAYARHDHNWKSSREIVHRLLRVVSLGGNYMLNVGPTGRGVIPEESAAILCQVGRWVRRNADAIYGTRRSPVPAQAWGCCTQRPGKVYLHVLNWPQGGELWMPQLRTRVTRAAFLAGGKRLPFRQTAGHLCVRIPERPPDPLATTIVLAVSGPAKTSRQAIILHQGLANEFAAPQARLNGCRLGKRKWMEKYGDWHHADVIEAWRNGGSARWHFTAPKPGVFYLYLEYQCSPDADYSEFEMNLGGVRWTFPVMSTGGPTVNRVRLRHERLGVVAIPAAGTHTLSIRSLRVKGKDAFILSKVTLQPFPEGS
jgi:alpha-L-fucosidase